MLGPALPESPPGWESCGAAGTGFRLARHPDLELTAIDGERFRLVILGYMLDPWEPDRSTRECGEALQCCPDLQSLRRAIWRFGGRWVVLVASGQDVEVLHDAGAMRQVFFSRGPGGTYCASQPHVLAYILHKSLRDNTGLNAYLASDAFQKGEREWVGDDTAFDGIYHLLPNHALDLRIGRARRFYPEERFRRAPERKVINVLSRGLSGLLKAAVNRRPLVVGLTAGIDSRVILAACRGILDRVEFVTFVSDRAPRHTDRRVASQLARDFGLNHTVCNTGHYAPDHRWVAGFKESVWSHHSDEKMNMHFALSRAFPDRWFVTGTMSEVVRSFFPRVGKPDRYRLAHGYRKAGFPYLVDQVGGWLQRLPPFLKLQQDYIYDLFYWEQRIGNWGAAFAAEFDVVTENLIPWNCRELLHAGLSTPRARRRHYSCALHRAVIRQLWPELLSVPFNPGNDLRGRTKDLLARCRLLDLASATANRFRYRRARRHYFLIPDPGFQTLTGSKST